MLMLQAWIEGLPWGAKALLIVGGSLMSAFSSVFPPMLQAVGAYTGVGLAFVGSAGVALHEINRQREKRGKPRFTVEPQHFIVLGLAIALAGVAWQFYQGPKVVKEVVTQQSVPAPTAPQQPVAKPTRVLSDDERQARREALKALLTQVRGPIREPLIAAKVIMVESESLFREKGPVPVAQSVLSLSKVYKASFSDLHDLLRTNAGMPDIINIASWSPPGVEWERYASRISTSSMVFHTADSEVTRRQYEWQYVGASAEAKEFRESLEKYENWISDTTDAITKKQRDIASPTYQIEDK